MKTKVDDPLFCSDKKESSVYTNRIYLCEAHAFPVQKAKLTCHTAVLGPPHVSHGTCKERRIFRQNLLVRTYECEGWERARMCLFSKADGGCCCFLGTVSILLELLLLHR